MSIYLKPMGITRGSNLCQYCSTPHRGAAEGAESWLRKSLCVKAAGGAGSRYKAPPLPPPRSHSSGTRSTPVVAFTHKNLQPDAPGTYHSQTHRGRTTARRTGDAARRGPGMLEQLLRLRTFNYDNHV